MIRTDWPFVHEKDDGIRPAGKPDECFYCHQKVGKRHQEDCVIVTKKIKVRYTFEIEVDVPYFWGKQEFESHRNESSSCFDNTIREIEEYGETHGCLCGIGKAEFLEITDETPQRKIDE